MSSKSSSWSAAGIRSACSMPPNRVCGVAAGASEIGVGAIGVDTKGVDVAAGDAAGASALCCQSSG